MVNKNLDGIKKLSGEELEMARKVVLDSIGERDKRERKGKDISNFSLSSRKKMLDGISSGRVRPAQQKFIPLKKQAVGEKAGQDKNLSVGLPELEKIKKSSISFSVLPKPAGPRRSLASGLAEVEKAAEEGARVEEEKRKRREKKVREAEGERIKEEERRKKEIEKQRGEEVRKRVAKEKEKIKIKKQKEKIRQERKKQEELARKIWLAEKKRKLSGLKDKFWKSFRLAGKILAFSALFLIVLTVLSYLVFTSLLLKFNLDNQVSRQIASYVPVPAVITKIGFLGYYDYQTIMAELEKELGSGQELEQTAKVIFIEKISLINLARKYNISLSGREQEEVEKEINARLAVDKEANEVSYSRIIKIKELITRSINAKANGRPEESFEEIGRKYGDEQGDVNEDNEYLQLKEEVRQLAAGQVSNIIITERGYYIIEKEDMGLKYIFVKSITFDEYLNDMVNKLKVWVLAN